MRVLTSGLRPFLPLARRPWTRPWISPNQQNDRAICRVIISCPNGLSGFNHAWQAAVNLMVRRRFTMRVRQAGHWLGFASDLGLQHISHGCGMEEDGLRGEIGEDCGRCG